MSTGAQLRAEGIDAVLAADTSVTRDFAALVREAVDFIGAGDWGRYFTAEDARAVIEEWHPGARPHSPNVIPAVFQHLAAEGRIRPVGWTTATRPEARGRALRVWRTT